DSQLPAQVCRRPLALNPRQNSAQVGRDTPALVPLARIAQRYLFEPRAIAPIRPADMDMAGNDDLRIVADMPVFRARRAAPGREARCARNIDKVASQRKMIDQYGLLPRRQLREALL